MIADRRTLEALDFAAIRERVIARTVTERGRRRAEALVPLADIEEAREAQAATQAMADLIAAADMHVQRAIDTQALTQRAALGTSLSATELRSAGEAIDSAERAYKRTRELVTPELTAITADFRSLKNLQHAILEAIDERGQVLERASPALGRIRKSLIQAQNEARDRVNSLIRSPKFSRAIQEQVVTIRDGRFVVPVKAEFSADVPGIVHDTSSSGQTFFVEPLAALDANNRVRTLRIDEAREVERVLEALSRLVGGQAAQIEANVDMLAQLDILVAKAQLAASMDARRPELTDRSELRIEDGRHPLLTEKAIPQSLELDEATRLLVISGPNMGGKTVALKMAGLFAVMAYCGLQIPATQARIGRCALVIADIGDEQSIAENTSTFSAHLARMREIFANAGAYSLVLIDEIGGGTEPTSGAALAIAMLERLLAAGACAIVTTHSTELKLFAHDKPGVANASVRFDPQTFQPTYHLDVGTPGQSLAFPLARAMGIPNEIVERAAELLSSRDRDYEQALAQLSDLNSNLQQERERVERESRHLEVLQTNLRARTENLEKERRSFMERAEDRMQQALRAFAQRLAEARAAAPKVTRGQTALLQRTLQEVRADLGISASNSTENIPAHGQNLEGSTVRVVSLGQEGSVIADNGESLLVAVGPMKTVVPRSDVQRVMVQEAPKKRSGAADARLEAAATAKTELDVRGKRYLEAEPEVEHWIDAATLAGSSPLRLIHGKGTGMLGRGLQEFLRAHPHVTNVRYGNENEGGAGVTIFELR